MATVQITSIIIEYIKEKNKHIKKFEIIPKLHSVWNVEQYVTYKNVCNGEPLVELSNDKNEWLRLPINLCDIIQ
jgi:hypothetical protein